MSSNIKKTKSIKSAKLAKPTKTKKIKKLVEEDDDNLSIASSGSSTGGANEIAEKNTEPVGKVKTVLAKENTPVIVQMPELNSNIFDNEPQVTFSSNIDYPRSEYGFHHFIHNNKNKTEKLKIFEGKKRVYLVFNRFERNIDGHNESIGNVSKEFFSSNDKPDILSRGFYKLWEILMLFNLIDPSQDKFVSAHLAEGPGSFVQATMFYRDTYSKKTLVKSDKYYAVAMHQDDLGGKNHIPELEKKFVDYYQKEKPQRFMLQPTISKKQSGGLLGGAKTKLTNGDITNPKTLKLFENLVGGQLDEKADLITGDGGLDWVNENIQEQEAFRLIIAQVVASAKLQKKGGNFVCKFFETFTKTSLKIVSMLKMLYNEVYFVKPLTSRLSNSEKYAVCIGFKWADKDKIYIDIVKKLNELYKIIHENKSDKIVDIFPTFAIPTNLIRTMIELNKEISNPQLKSIGEIISFVEKEVYSGDEYHDRKEDQIDGAKFWNATFLPTQENLEKNKKITNSIVSTALEFSKKEIDKLNKLLVHVENQE